MQKIVTSLKFVKTKYDNFHLFIVRGRFLTLLLVIKKTKALV